MGVAINSDLTADELRKLLDYNPDTGIFTWKVYRSSNAPIGKTAGYNDQTLGYSIIRIKRNYYAHRLAWLYFYNKWPKVQVDHINGDGFDNRICNLREATNSQNLWNRPKQKNNKIGLKGVSFFPLTQKWRARIRVNGKDIYLGHYFTKEEAHKAYLSASKKYHGEFARF